MSKFSALDALAVFSRVCYNCCTFPLAEKLSMLSCTHCRVRGLLAACVLTLLSGSVVAQSPALLPDPVAPAVGAHPSVPAHSGSRAAVREFGPGSARTHAHASSGSSGSYVVQSGDTLNEVLQGWARRNGWTVSWEIVGRNLSLGAGARFEGDLIEVVNALIDSLGGEVAHLNVEMHQGNRVIRVTENTKGRKE